VPADLMIYVAITIVLVIWLRNVLGTRNGEENDRSESISRLEEHINNEKGRDPSEKLVLDLTEDIPEKNVKALKIKNPDIAEKLVELTHTLPGFNPLKFVNGAKDAFAMIVESFAQGDLRTLKDLLSPGVYNAFENEIHNRQDRGETVQTDIHQVKSAEILGITRLDRMIFIKLRFIAEETCVIRDREGMIISGNPDKITVMNDVWTFGKDAKSKDPTWYLFETADDEIEDQKTPIPDAS
jgi:predicted lipid-binding transport protein (Tim44 family)